MLPVPRVQRAANSAFPIDHPVLKVVSQMSPSGSDALILGKPIERLSSQPKMPVKLAYVARAFGYEKPRKFIESPPFSDCIKLEMDISKNQARGHPHLTMATWSMQLA